MSDSSPRYAIALEELKLLQAVIHKQDDARSHIVGWSVAVVVALTVAYLSDKGLTGKTYCFLGTVVVLLFLWLDVVHKVAQDRAISRVKAIEKSIRTGTYYIGPCIAGTLTRPNTLYEQCLAARNVRVWAPYATLFLTVLLVSL
jgi:hypothetical protein